MTPKELEQIKLQIRFILNSNIKNKLEIARKISYIII